MVVLTVSGVAGIVQTGSGGAAAIRLDRLGRSLPAEAGLTKPTAAAAHSVLYSYLLGSINLQESRWLADEQRSNPQGAKCSRVGLDVIIAGIKASLPE
jgi:TetR/AcrR family tetracycline transcriptional repressor